MTSLLKKRWLWICLVACICVKAIVLSGCAIKQEVPAGTQRKEEAKPPLVAEPKEEHDGKYYKDDGPPDVDEVDWRTVQEPVPVFEPIKKAYNRPYEVFGVRYLPFTDYTHYRKQGMASWYGKRYHGRKTSSGEVYDMYDMTAAHTVLPIPSYARVTRVDDGRSIIVRVNDRGPFLNERIIDLSYTAARKLGIVSTGVGEVIVEALLPGDDIMLAGNKKEEKDVQQASYRRTQKADGSHYLQLGAFSSIDNATALAESIGLPDGMFKDSLITLEQEGLHRVLVGPYDSKFQAERDLERIHDAGLEALLKVF